MGLFRDRCDLSLKDSVLDVGGVADDSAAPVGRERGRPVSVWVLSCAVWLQMSKAPNNCVIPTFSNCEL